MELRVNEVQLPEVISFNYEELKAEITAVADKYANCIYNEDGIKGAKADRADLNRVKKALNDDRIRREKEYLKPFDDFKTKINELISIIDKPVKLIDTQIKSYEEQQKQNKKQSIIEYFDTLAKPEWLDFNRIFNEKWLNASVKMSAIQDEINAKLEQIQNDLNTLSKLPEFAFEATEEYKRTLDVNRAISEGSRLAEIAKRKAEHKAMLKAQAEARAKAAEEARQRAEAERQAQAQREAEQAVQMQEAQEVQEQTVEETQPEVKKQWVNFSAFLSTDDAIALKQFFNGRNIEFKAI